MTDEITDQVLGWLCAIPGTVSAELLHALNNKLALIVSSLEIVRRTVADPAKSSGSPELIERIDKAIKQACAIRNELMPFHSLFASVNPGNSAQPSLASMKDALTALLVKRMRRSSVEVTVTEAETGLDEAAETGAAPFPLQAASLVAFVWSAAVIEFCASSTSAPATFRSAAIVIGNQQLRLVFSFEAVSAGGPSPLQSAFPVLPVAEGLARQSGLKLRLNQLPDSLEMIVAR